MTRTQISAIAIAFSTLFAGQAMAADTAPVTRAQVKAELAESIQAGYTIINESGERMKDAFPHNYPAQAASSVTRAQVKAELAEAVRNGEVLVGDSSHTLNEIFPHNYASQQNVASKTREQVQMELAEAAANGILDRHIPA